ncbi:hypothetical protein CR513_15055, partial [Mucuna pruriens]
MSHSKVQNENSINIISIRSDHEGEFENENIQQFCEERGTFHNFSYPRTYKKNGVVERNKLISSILNDFNFPKFFYTEVTYTKKTAYELWKGRKSNILYFHLSDMNTKENLGKFDPKLNKGTFLGYLNASTPLVLEDASFKEYLVLLVSPKPSKVCLRSFKGKCAWEASKPST